MAKKEKKDDDVFSMIEKRYFQLDREFDKLLSACKSEDEKKELKRDYIIARSNYKKSMNLTFDQNDPIIKELTGELSSIEKRIEKDIKVLQNAGSVLKMISESVKIASSIIVTVSSFV